MELLACSGGGGQDPVEERVREFPLLNDVSRMNRLTLSLSLQTAYIGRTFP
jgi:hypothetical protein